MNSISNNRKKGPSTVGYLHRGMLYVIPMSGRRQHQTSQSIVCYYENGPSECSSGAVRGADVTLVCNAETAFGFQYKQTWATLPNAPWGATRTQMMMYAWTGEAENMTVNVRR